MGVTFKNFIKRKGISVSKWIEINSISSEAEFISRAKSLDLKLDSDDLASVKDAWKISKARKAKVSNAIEAVIEASRVLENESVLAKIPEVSKRKPRRKKKTSSKVVSVMSGSNG